TPKARAPLHHEVVDASRAQRQRLPEPPHDQARGFVRPTRPRSRTPYNGAGRDPQLLASARPSPTKRSTHPASFSAARTRVKHTAIGSPAGAGLPEGAVPLFLYPVAV